MGIFPPVPGFFRSGVCDERTLGNQVPRAVCLPTRSQRTRWNGHPRRLIRLEFFCSLLGLCGRLPELDLISVEIIDPGKAAVGFIHSLWIDLDSLLF